MKRDKRKNIAVPGGSPLDKRKLGWAVALIVCVGVVVYANALKGGFLWDDSHLVEENRFIRNGSNIPQILTKDVGAGADSAYRFYRPVQILTYLVDHSIWRLNPAGYHLGNILWHILAALALFWLVLVLFKDHLLACVTALLFVAHPVHTEAVTYISGRADPLSTFFVLLTFVFYIKAADTRKISLLLAAVLSYAAALLSKENALIMVPLVLLYHYTFRRKIYKPGVVFLTVLAVAYVVLRFTLLKYMLAHAVAPSSLLQRLPGFLEAWASYLRLLLVPVRLHMEYGVGESSFVHPRVILGLFVLSALLFVIFREKEKRSLVFFSSCWFFLTLLPVSNLYPINAYMAEHWLYLPSIGFFLLVAKVFSSGLRRERTKVPALIGLLLLTGLWGALTVRQNATWLRPIPFYKRLLRYAPQSSRLHNALGLAYNKMGDYEKGVSYLERAVELGAGASTRDAANACNNLAYAYDKLGRDREAAQAAERALALDATYVKAYNNLAVSYIRLGKYKEAAEACRRAVALKPGYPEILNTLGAAYMHLERYDEALETYRKVIEIDPDYAEVYSNAGLALQRMGRAREAIPWHEKAIELQPGYADAYSNLVDAYEALGEADRARAARDRFLALDPKYARAHDALAATKEEAAE